MPPSDALTTDVLARCRDFVSDRVQWQRKLWDVGILAALQELREASVGVRLGALSLKALRWQATSVASRLRHDPGAGDDQQRRAIAQVLSQDLSEAGVNDLELELWLRDIEQHYLERWRTAVTAGTASREQVARALVAFLLSKGFSHRGLSDWTRDLVADATPFDTSELLERAATRVAWGTELFEALLLFDKPPGGNLARPTEWRSATQASRWLRDAGFPPKRQRGGLLLTLQARDAYGAAEQAAEISGRLLARGAVGTREGFALAEEVFIRGMAGPVTMIPSRRAEVRALERENRLLDIDAGGPVDAALELLSHVNRGPDAVAAAAGWSAVESLLTGPGDDDKVVTADRLADLVACSWPRAELTTIAWARIYQQGDELDALAEELRNCATNRERAGRVLEAIENEEDLHLVRTAEQLAVRRMERLVRNPRDELLAVQRRAAECLRRVYRQRNLVVHGGQVGGLSLSLSLRAAAPLIGAGLDRVTHAALVNAMHPLEIAARAHFEISRVGTTNAPRLTELLE